MSVSVCVYRQNVSSFSCYVLSVGVVVYFLCDPTHAFTSTELANNRCCLSLHQFCSFSTVRCFFPSQCSSRLSGFIDANRTHYALEHTHGAHQSRFPHILILNRLYDMISICIHWIDCFMCIQPGHSGILQTTDGNSNNTLDLSLHQLNPICQAFLNGVGPGIDYTHTQTHTASAVAAAAPPPHHQRASTGTKNTHENNNSNHTPNSPASSVILLAGADWCISITVCICVVC